MAMRCLECGYLNQENTATCIKCGTPIEPLQTVEKSPVESSDDLPATQKIVHESEGNPTVKIKIAEEEEHPTIIMKAPDEGGIPTVKITPASSEDPSLSEKKHTYFTCTECHFYPLQEPATTNKPCPNCGNTGLKENNKAAIKVMMTALSK